MPLRWLEPISAPRCVMEACRSNLVYHSHLEPRHQRIQRLAEWTNLMGTSKNSFWPSDRKSDSVCEWIAWARWRAMGQPGFFDLDRRLEAISAKGDALETIKAAVPWED